ncbi:MAG: hypothetical protein WAO00_08395 [Chthoniobacterales bacterium]
MRTPRNRVCHFFALALIAILASWAAPARALVLDWDGVSWTPGSLSNSFNLNGDAFNDITVAITSQNPNIFTNDPATGTMTPAINQTMTGGLVPAQNSLIIAANLHTNSNLTVHLSFTGGTAGNLPGANNVSFTLFDIDVTTNSDIISNIYGVAPDGTHIAATITNLGSAVTLAGSGLGQTLTGNAASANNSSNGNATISFGATLITDLYFTFGNTAGAPRYQDIGIGDITFTPVPEINPAISASVSSFVAVGLTVLMQRRAKKRRLVPRR